MSDQRIEQARNVLARGGFDEVIQLLKPLLNEMPENMEIRSLLTEAQEGMMLRLQLSQKVKKANELLQAGDREGALKTVEGILGLDPTNPDALGIKRILEVPQTQNLNATIGFDFGDQVLEAGDIAAGADTQEQAFPTTGLDELEPFSLAPETPAPPAVEEMPAEALSDVQAFDMSQPAPSLGGDEIEAFPLDAGTGGDHETEATRLSTDGAAPFSFGGESGKISSFIAEGKGLMAEGKYQEAVDTLTRVFILDEENQEAQGLIDQAKAKLQNREQEVNLVLQEAIGAYDGQEYDRAKELFGKVLELSPRHREADYYLKEIGARSGSGGMGFQLDAPSTGAAGTGADSFSFDTPGASSDDLASLMGEPEPAPSTEAPPPPPVAAPQPPAAPHAKVKAPPPAKAKKEGKGAPVGLIIGIILALSLVGGGIFVVPMLLEKFTSPKPTAKPIPPPAEKKKSETKTAAATTPPPAAQPQKSSSDLLLEAKTAVQDKQFDKAVNLLTQAQSLDKANMEITTLLETAKAGLAKQQEEQAKVQRFVSDFEKASKYFKMAEYGEAVRISWRLIYPKDQEAFAVQMGKAEEIRRIIRNGYYNWAVKDLKAGNPVVAKKNLQDLLDFDPKDPKARELLGFADKYSRSAVDDAYRAKVQELSFRTIEE